MSIAKASENRRAMRAGVFGPSESSRFTVTIILKFQRRFSVILLLFLNSNVKERQLATMFFTSYLLVEVDDR
jgi:hypothetical protein